MNGVDSMKIYALLLVTLLFLTACAKQVDVQEPANEPDVEEYSSVCGDGVCEENEPGVCFEDCGSPREDVPSECGNGVCEEDEPGVCFDDCGYPTQEGRVKSVCGNGVCEEREVAVGNCPEDCGE